MSEPIVTLRLRMLALTSEDGLGVSLAIDRDGTRCEVVTMSLEAARWVSQTIHDWAAAPDHYEGPDALWLPAGEPVGDPLEPAPREGLGDG